MKEGIRRAGTQFAYQGNMDSGVLFGSHDMIEQRVRETAKAAKEMGVRHIMNLGHGIMQVWGGRNRHSGLPAARRSRSVLGDCCSPGLPWHACSGLSAKKLVCDADWKPSLPSLPQGTPEENAAHFFKVAKELRYADL